VLSKLTLINNGADECYGTLYNTILVLFWTSVTQDCARVILGEYKAL